MSTIELGDVLERNISLQILRPGVRLRPISAGEAPIETIFLNSDGAGDRLCYKDGDGSVFQFRMKAI